MPTVTFNEKIIISYVKRVKIVAQTDFFFSPLNLYTEKGRTYYLISTRLFGTIREIFFSLQ